jgi:hypothetical protein
MLTLEETKALLVARLNRTDRCNSYFLNHLKGQVRGILGVITGEVPTHSDDVRVVLKDADIPFKDTGDGRIEYDDDWLIAHGFTIDHEHDTCSHPRFSATW